MSAPESPQVHTLIVGGGQAGLATARALQRRGRVTLVLDAGPGPGSAWRNRWDSLQLFTPARFSALPDAPFPADPDHLPTKDEVAEYLAGYVDRFALAVQWGTRVTGVDRAEDGPEFRVDTTHGMVRARQVVLAAGAQQVPWVPALDSLLADDLPRLHTATYRNPDQVPGPRVLVVGGGNSGLQIARELAEAGRRVTLSLGARLPVAPTTLAGRSIFTYLDRLGLLRLRPDSTLGRRAQRTGDLVIGPSPAALRRRLGIRLVGRALAVTGDAVACADGEHVGPDAVVWATGFRPDHRWINLPVLHESGAIRQHRGLTGVPGLVTIGLPWQATSTSGIFYGLGADADRLAHHLASLRPEEPAMTGR
ncbi:flavin-containing monooxygenase [Segeticoccus rhizosphaerae]|uniref:flavin-containing monooxygenase n=1 Tax=Segeticoccus rhizosphaerae TaxID=1104777 RepID=UPI0010C10754|nr:NAD(P)/FAD-dependent oxidoreductase [Ornithinicoccus soli]